MPSDGGVHVKARAAAALTLCATLALGACGKAPTMSMPEQQAVDALTHKLIPHCVGRYLLEMPPGMTTRGTTKIRGIMISTQAMAIDAFQAEIAKRGAELKAVKSVDADPFLYANTTSPDGQPGYFMHRGAVDADPARRTLEGYRWENGVRIQIQREAWDFTDPDQSANPLVGNVTVKNNVPQRRFEVLNMLDSFRGLPAGSVPTKPALCIPGGYLLGKSRPYEYVDVRFDLPSYPGVSFHILTHSSLHEAPSLLERDGFDAATGAPDGWRTLRKGVVRLPMELGEEWLIGRPAGTAGEQEHLFRLEIGATDGSPDTPYFALTMRNRGPASREDPSTPAAFTEAQALALWDAVSTTLRPRPNAF
jgi:hypothetical protein